MKYKYNQYIHQKKKKFKICIQSTANELSKLTSVNSEHNYYPLSGINRNTVHSFNNKFCTCKYISGIHTHKYFPKGWLFTTTTTGVGLPRKLQQYVQNTSFQMRTVVQNILVWRKFCDAISVFRIEIAISDSQG